ncbi:MAG: ferredoxin [Gammaproteobacteria bacterium]|nr:ferredoxin [Gammaproteobacteria bacterium]
MTSNEPTESPLPAMPPSIKDGEATRRILYDLRHFHLGDPTTRVRLEVLDKDFLPALLAPYRDASRLQYDYPLYLHPPEAGYGNEEGTHLAQPVAGFLEAAVDNFASGVDSARILKDNLQRLEWAIRKRLFDVDIPVEAGPLLRETSEEMVAQLALDADSTQMLKADIEQLLAVVPDTGQFLAYGHYPAIHLMIHLLRSRLIPRHNRFLSEIDKLAQGLEKLLQIEKEKSLESLEPAMVREAIGPSSGMFNAAALSEVMDHSQGSMGMSEERRRRIEQALQTLKSYEMEPVLVRFVHLEGIDESIFSTIPGFESITTDNPCVRAKELFDQEAARLAEIFSATRIAKLEIDNRYDEAIHDPWFESFNWEAFSQEELLLVPAVVALETALRAAGSAMPDFSRLLNSGRPVQILIRVLAHANPGRDTDTDPFAHFRTELGYLGISHRQAVVSQTSAARHQHLLHQFSTALKTTRTGMHMINVGLRPTGQDLGLNGWLVAGAALEGRAHPFFQINPAAGDSFADRMDFSDNPQPKKDWPLHPFSYLDDDGQTVSSELAFTFADYALLIQRLREHFVPVPLACDSELLLPVAEYLAMPEEESAQHIPYVWAINSNGELRQLAVTRTLIHACRDRLNFWRSLQEMAGVRSRYLELGIARARQQINAAAEAEKAQLQEAHQEEIEQVRAEVAGEVMGRLTGVLMGMDLTTGGMNLSMGSVVTSPAPEEETVDSLEPDAPPQTEVAEETLGFDEPWVDSPLCTSCNDCLMLNPLLFVYNDNKQAVIADPSAGTFAQLVEAAEFCPSKCIHPGNPQDPTEAGLDDLIERAQPFN